MSLDDQVAASLSVLVGKPFWGCGRASDMQWFQFGGRKKVLSQATGKERDVGEYALHVHCAWRIQSPVEIVVASRDMYYPRGSDPELNYPGFDWDKVGANRCDERVATFVADVCPLSVLVVNADNVGGFKLSLAQDYELDVFPDDSLDDEHWRMLQPREDTPHLILSGHRLERA